MKTNLKIGQKHSLSVRNSYLGCIGLLLFSHSTFPQLLCLQEYSVANNSQQLSDLSLICELLSIQKFKLHNMRLKLVKELIVNVGVSLLQLHKYLSSFWQHLLRQSPQQKWRWALQWQQQLSLCPQASPIPYECSYNDHRPIR